MKRSRLPTTSRRAMAYKVVETDAVHDELVRTLDYLEFVLSEPSFAKKLAGAYLEFLGNIKSFPAMYPEARDSRLRAAGYRKASPLGYVVLYLLKEDMVTVIHLFHQSQDYAQLV